MAMPLLLAGLLALLGAGACERSDTPAPQRSAAAQAGSFQRDAAPDAAGGPAILMLGDSLTAGHGLLSERSFPALIQSQLRAGGYPHRVVNAGVSGDTSAGGLARLDWLLRQRVDVMVLALGANDGLRGQDPQATRGNLAQIIERAQARGITVVLAGMEMPLNYGADYTRRYRAIFPALAEQYGLALIPFLLEGVALRPELNQPDGIHPNAQGAKIVAANVWRVLEPVLE